MVAVAKKKQERTAFGRRLRALRESKGLSQTQLAERVEMPYQAIAKYERGAVEPGWPTVLRLAEALGVTPDAFLAGEVSDDQDEPAPPPPRRRRKK
jgi:transcriptional regulator with XRE-family HTH domain